MKIRTACKDDIPAMNDLEIQSDLFHFGADYPAHPLDQTLTDDLIRKGFLLVAVDPQTSTLTGFIAYNVWDDENVLFIEQISVAVNFARQGIATLLMQEVLDQAREKGCASIGLTTNTQAEWSGGLYHKFGFAAVAEDKVSAKVASILKIERAYKSTNRAYLSLML